MLTLLGTDGLTYRQRLAIATSCLSCRDLA